MSSAEERKLDEALRAIYLRSAAAHDIGGLYGYARNAAEKRTMWQLLQDLSHGGRRTPQESTFLSVLLMAIGEGRDVRKELRIDARKVGHRPAQKVLIGEIVRELEQCMADGQRTKDGNPSNAALARVGMIIGKDAGAVRKIWERAKREALGQ